MLQKIRLPLMIAFVLLAAAMAYNFITGKDGANDLIKNRAQAHSLLTAPNDDHLYIQFCLSEFRGEDYTCLTKLELLQSLPQSLRIARVAADQSRQMVNMNVTLHHPKDNTKLDIFDCQVFMRKKREGWGAMTTNAMDDEQKFERYCGIYPIANMAKVQQSSDFNYGRLSFSDLSAIPTRAWPSLGENAGNLSFQEVEKDKYWIGKSDSQLQVIAPIAHADFNDDGRGDMLIFVISSAVEGSASFSNYMLVEKNGAKVTLKPIDPYQLPEVDMSIIQKES